MCSRILVSAARFIAFERLIWHAEPLYSTRIWPRAIFNFQRAAGLGPCQALGLHFRRHIIRQRRGWRARAAAVDEAEGLVEARLGRHRLEPESFDGLFGLGVFDDVTKDQFAFTPGVAGVHEGVDVFAFD